MTSIIRDIERDIDNIDVEIGELRERISLLPRTSKREYRESVRLLSLLRKDKISLLNMYHNIVQDLTIKRQLLEAQRVVLEVEAARLLTEDVERSEADEQFEAYFNGLMKRTSELVSERDSELIREQVLNIGKSGE